MSDWPKSWQVMKLGNVASRIVSGATPESGSSRYYAAVEGTPFAKIDDLSRSPGMYLTRTSFRVTPAALRETSLEVYPAGTILLSMYGTIGLVKITAEPLSGNQALAALLPPYSADPHFLCHYLSWLRPSWVKYQGQTTQANISGAIIRNAEFPFPSLGEQRRIAEILDVLDAQVSSIDSQLAKMNVRDAAICASLIDVRDVPSRPLSSYLRDRPRNGFSPVETDGWTGVKALGLGCLTLQGFRPVQIKDVPARDSRNAAATLADGDLLISRANTRDLVGLAGIYRDIGVPCIYPDLMMRLRCNSDCLPEFLELLLRNPEVRRQIQAHAQGTSESMVKISGSIVRELRVRVPGLGVQKQVLYAVKMLQGESEQLREKRLKVLAVRSGLAEDLLTGRVRV